MQAMLTTREISESIKRQYGGSVIPGWKLRRIIDDLDARNLLTVQRIGPYRAVAGSDIPIIAEELRRLCWLPSEVAAC